MKPCSFDGCDGKYFAKGWCKAHFEQMRTRGWTSPVRRRKPRGQAHWWHAGYLWVSGPDGAKIGYHRLVAAQALGRPLTSRENVHHINGDRSDNRIENLEVWTTPQPRGQRVADLVAWVVEAYPELVRRQLKEHDEHRVGSRAHPERRGEGREAEAPTHPVGPGGAHEDHHP